MKSRIRGKPFAIGLVALLAIVFAVVMVRWKQTRWPEGRTVGVTAAEGERAFVLLRAATQRYAGYLLCVERERGPIWDAAIYGLQIESGRAVTVLPGELVTVRAKDDEGHLETFAFNQDNGVYQWHGGRAREDAEVSDTGPITFVREADATVVAELYVGPHPELIGIRIADGAEAYRIALPLEAPMYAQRVGRSILLVDLEHEMAYEIETGAVSPERPDDPQVRALGGVLHIDDDRYVVSHDAQLASLAPGYAFRSERLLGRIEGSEITHLVEVAGPFELREEQITEERMWIASPDGVRVLDPSTLRPLRSYSSVPSVTDRAEEIARLVPLAR